MVIGVRILFDFQLDNSVKPEINYGVVYRLTFDVYKL